MARRIAFLFLISFTFHVAALPQGPSAGVRPVIVHGAVRSETEKLASSLDSVSIERVGGNSIGF